MAGASGLLACCPMMLSKLPRVQPWAARVGSLIWGATFADLWSYSVPLNHSATDKLLRKRWGIAFYSVWFYFFWSQVKRWRRNISSLLRSNFFFNYLADAYKLWMQATQYLHSLHQEHAWYCPWSPSVRWRGWSPPFWRLSEPTWTQHSSKRGEEGEGGEGTTQEDVKPVERREKEKEIRGQRRGEEKSRGEEVTIAGRVRKERAEGSSEVHLGKIKHGCKYVFVLGVFDISCWAVKLSEMVLCLCCHMNSERHFSSEVKQHLLYWACTWKHNI